MIYSQFGILYEIILDALQTTRSVEKHKPGTHADGVFRSVKTPTVESLEKQLHELSIKYSTVETTKDTHSSQNANIFAQSSQNTNQYLDGKNKKGKIGEGNQNKPKPTNNVDGGGREEEGEISL